MTKKTIDFGKNICYYIDYDDGGSSSIEYVRPCPKDQYCYHAENSDYELHTCEPILKGRKTLGESCDTDFECESALECSSKKCSFKSHNPYTVYDSASSEFVSHCISNQIATYNSLNPSYPVCIDVPSGTSKSDYDGKFYVSKNNVNKYLVIQPYQVPGQIHFKTKQTGLPYEIDYIDLADIGSQVLGTFVYDERACETGFALKFYADGSLVEPADDNTMYLRCAKLVEFLSNNQVVYSIQEGTEKLYNSQNSFSSNLVTKLDMFTNYKSKLNVGQCKTDYAYSEPFTCKNDEVRKWWYFYNNPDDYLLYKDEKLVVSYLVKEEYPEYATDLTENAGFLALKYLFYLLILLSL